MTTTQAKQLRDFLSRIGMYIQPINQKTITSFIHGFELGTNRDFTKQLTQYLKDEKGIKCRSLGWPNQIERLAIQNQSDWLTTFKEVSYDLILPKLKSRGYLLIEPTLIAEILKESDFDLAIRCLEFLRNNVASIFPTLVDSCEFDLIAVTTPHNNGFTYPMLGLYCDDKSKYELIPNFETATIIVDEYINQLSVEMLFEMSKDFDYIDWAKLEKLGTFPER